MKASSFLSYWKVLSMVLAMASFLVFSACSSSDDDKEPGLVISGISPSSGPKETVVTISGTGFNSNAVSNVVMLNTIACTVVSASSTELKVTIPPKGGSGKLTVTVNGKSGETPLFTYVNSADEIPPVISSISPLTGYINTVVTITGSGFSSNAVDNFVTLNDKTCTVTSASATELKITIPSKAGSGRMKVKVRELTAETPEFTYLYSVFTKTVFAGSTPSDFNVPIGIALDADGNLLVADFSDRMVKKVTPSGAVSVLAGATVGQLINPYEVAADSKGNVYVSDRGDHKIKKITSAGVVSVLAGNTVGEFSTPSGIAVDRDDNIYVADMDNNKIKKITPAGVVSSFIDFPAPVSLAFDGDGNVYVANAYQIKKIVGGVVNPFAGSIQGDDEKFDNIQFITVDNKGTVYVTDHNNFKIKKISAQRAVSTISNVSNPYGIVVDENDDLYVAISIDGVVIKIVQE